MCPFFWIWLNCWHHLKGLRTFYDSISVIWVSMLRFSCQIGLLDVDRLDNKIKYLGIEVSNIMMLEACCYILIHLFPNASHRKCPDAASVGDFATSHLTELITAVTSCKCHQLSVMIKYLKLDEVLKL